MILFFKRGNNLDGDEQPNNRLNTQPRPIITSTQRSKPTFHHLLILFEYYVFVAKKNKHHKEVLVKMSHEKKTEKEYVLRPAPVYPDR
jgi:hypothetical protein